MMGAKLRKLTSFGPSVLVTSIMHSVCVRVPFAKNFGKYWNERRHEAVIRYLMSRYGHVVGRHRDDAVVPQSEVVASGARIWTMWWQGEEAMPEEARICLASMRKNSSGHEVVVVSKNNLGDYVELPAHIREKIGREISYTHLSDIVRVMLLQEHGGLWLDACFLCASPIPEYVFREGYFTVKHPPLDISCISLGRWVGSVTGCGAGRAYSAFLSDFFVEYWREENALIDYFLIDYVTEIAYREIPAFKEALDSLPVSNERLYMLNDQANAPLVDSLEDALGKGCFYALSRKVPHVEVVGGKQTVYGAIKERWLVTEDLGEEPEQK